MSDNTFLPKPERDPLGKLKELFAAAPERIKAGFARETENNWLNILGDEATALSLALVGVAGELPSDFYEEAQRRLDALQEHIAELQSSYPSRDLSPPVELQEQLIAELDIFKK